MGVHDVVIVGRVFVATVVFATLSLGLSSPAAGQSLPPITISSTISPGDTFSTDQTIGNAGTTTGTAFSIYVPFNLGPGPMPPISSGTQVNLTFPLQFQNVSGTVNNNQPSSGYTLASGSGASGGGALVLTAAWPAAIAGGTTSPAVKVVLASNQVGRPPAFSPQPDQLFQVQALQFGTRSGSNGPTSLVVRSEQDNFTGNLGTAAVSSGSWQLASFAWSETPTRDRTYALYGVGGSGTSTWRIDDVLISGSVYSTSGYTLNTGKYSMTQAGTATIAANFPNVAGNAQFDVVDGATLTVTGSITGYLGAILKSGSGTVVLAGHNSYYANTQITAGTLVVSNTDAFGNSEVFVQNAATLDLQNLPIVNRVILRDGAALTNGGQFRGRLLVDSGTAMFKQAISGTIAVSQGAVGVLTGTVDPSASMSVGDGGKLQLGTGFNFQPGSLPNQGVVQFTNTGSAALASSISGTGSVLMSGSGIAVLSGSSSFTGGTQITAGSLAVSNPFALGQGQVNVQNGGTFILGAALSLGGSNAVSLSPGAALVASGSASAPIAAGSALGGVSFVGGGSAAAALLAGTASGTGGLLSTDWITNGKPSSAVTDILELKTPTGSAPFVLQMTYDPLVTGTDVSNLWLGWNSGTSGWVNAVDGNRGPTGTLAQQNYLGSFATLSASGTSPLSDYLGAYGRDATAHTVWAVVDHNSQFVAFVPEPGTLVLAAGALAILAGARWRRTGRA